MSLDERNYQVHTPEPEQSRARKTKLFKAERARIKTRRSRKTKRSEANWEQGEVISKHQFEFEC